MAQTQYNPEPSVEPSTTMPNDTQRIESSPSMFGGLIAQGAKELGQGAEQASSFYSQVAGDQGVNNADRQLLELMHGKPGATNPDGTPDTGFLGTRGQQTMNGWKGFTDSFDQIVKNTRDSLATPEAKLKFDEWSQRARNNYYSQASGWYDQQSHAWGSDVQTDTAKTTLNAISANPANDIDFSHRLGDLTQAFIKKAQMDGTLPAAMGPGQVLTSEQSLALQNAKEQAQQAAWKSRIEAIGANNPALAKQMADDHQKELGGMYPEVERQMRGQAAAATGTAVGTDAVKQAMAGAGTMPGNDWAAAYKARVHQIENPQGAANDVSPAGAKGWYQFEPATWTRLGGGNIEDRATQEQRMNQLSFQNYNLLTQGLGRAPTPAELYLAHQQGAQGALHLMADPSRRAADVVGEKAITGNGGTANMTAGQFVAMWQAKYNGTPIPPGVVAGATPNGGGSFAEGITQGAPPIEQASFQPSPSAQPAGDVIEPPHAPPSIDTPTPQVDLEQVRAAAYKAIADNPNLDPTERYHAERTVDRQIAEQAIMEGQTSKAREEQKHKALDEVASYEMKGDYLGAYHALQANQYIGPAEKLTIAEAIERRSGKSDPATLGPGYQDIFNRMLLPYDDPQRIKNPIDLIQAENAGQLMPKGTDRLRKMMQDINKPDELGEQQRIQAVFKVANQRLVHDLDIGSVKIPDPNGAESMNKFTQMFYNDYDKFRQTHPDGQGFPLFEKKAQDELFDQIRPKAQMNADMMGAGIAQGGANLPPAEQEAIPPPPPTVRPEVWNPLISAPPTMPNGQPATHYAWGKVLTALAESPTPEMFAQLRASKVWGKMNIDFDGLSQTLQGAAPAAEAGAEFKPAPPEPPKSISQRQDEAAIARRTAWWSAAKQGAFRLWWNTQPHLVDPNEAANEFERQQHRVGQ